MPDGAPPGVSRFPISPRPVSIVQMVQGAVSDTDKKRVFMDAGSGCEAICAVSGQLGSFCSKHPWKDRKSIPRGPLLSCHRKPPSTYMRSEKAAAIRARRLNGCFALFHSKRPAARSSVSSVSNHWVRLRPLQLPAAHDDELVANHHHNRAEERASGSGGRDSHFIVTGSNRAQSGIE